MLRLASRFVSGLALAAAVAAALSAGCAADRRPEERTDDGLVRVPSRASGGVYRAPGASFTQYKRFILEPATIAFTSTWRESHPEVSDAEFRRIRSEAIQLFHDEFKRELVDRGPYEFADTPAPDVMRITPRVMDLDIPAPDASTEVGMRSYTPGPVKMQVVGEFHDADSNVLLGRVIIFEGQSRYAFSEMRQANRATNAHEMRLGFGKWSKMFREALNVAKAGRPL